MDTTFVKDQFKLVFFFFFCFFQNWCSSISWGITSQWWLLHFLKIQRSRVARHFKLNLFIVKMCNLGKKWKIPAVESVILCHLLWKSYWIIEHFFSLQIYLNQNLKSYSWNLGTLLVLLESLQWIRFNEGALEIFCFKRAKDIEFWIIVVMEILIKLSKKWFLKEKIVDNSLEIKHNKHVIMRH